MDGGSADHAGAVICRLAGDRPELSALFRNYGDVWASRRPPGKARRPMSIREYLREEQRGQAGCIGGQTLSQLRNRALSAIAPGGD
jgi:hypothetical protein